MQRRTTELITITAALYTVGAVGALALTGGCKLKGEQPSVVTADDTPSPSGAEPGAGMGTSANACASEKTAPKCAQCCGVTDKTFEAPSTAYAQCACSGGCKDKCGSFCPDLKTQPSKECGECLGAEDTAKQCDQKAEDVCLANSGCKKAKDCLKAAECGNKEFPKGGG